MIETNTYKNLNNNDKKEVQKLYSGIENGASESLKNYMNNPQIIDLVSSVIKELGDNI